MATSAAQVFQGNGAHGRRAGLEHVLVEHDLAVVQGDHLLAAARVVIMNADGVLVSLPKKLKSSLPEKGRSRWITLSAPSSSVTACSTRSIMAPSLYWRA